MTPLRRAGRRPAALAPVHAVVVALSVLQGRGAPGSDLAQPALGTAVLWPAASGAPGTPGAPGRWRARCRDAAAMALLTTVAGVLAGSPADEAVVVALVLVASATAALAESAVLCPGLRAEQVPLVLERIQQAVSPPVRLPGGAVVRMGLSTGCRELRRR